jgi:tetratricopeptide (TPR) repeat protein
MVEQSNKPAYLWLIVPMAVGVVICALVYFLTEISGTTALMILGLVELIAVILFFAVRTLLPVANTKAGWADPVINPDKARKAAGDCEPGLSDDFISDTGRVAEEELAGEFLHMGRLLLKSDRFNEARDAFNKAAKQDPGNSKVYNYLGIACGRLNLYDEAVDAYNKAIALDYDYASAHFNLASVYEQMNDEENAQAQWQRYLDIGNVVGERADMIERAQDRLSCLQSGKTRGRIKTGAHRKPDFEDEST